MGSGLAPENPFAFAASYSYFSISAGDQSFRFFYRPNTRILFRRALHGYQSDQFSVGVSFT